MKILIIEPYLTGSHKQWAEGYQRHSNHEIEILGLSGNFWKWRMHGGAVTLAEKFNHSHKRPDLLLATDMLDLTTFISLTKSKSAGLPTAIYFHENQLSYPWSPTDRDVAQKRDKHYGFINYVSALAADAIFFNSNYHMQSFLAELWRFLKHFPDNCNLDSIDRIRAKSQVLPLGLDLSRLDCQPAASKLAETGNRANASKLILWNHRWEFDKNPAEFFQALAVLDREGHDFSVALLGECFSRQPKEFLEAREILGNKVVQFGYAEDFATYVSWLQRADILPVTSIQDFFGASIVEAIYCGCFPLLPRRLAYPELIATGLHKDFFYDDFADLLQRLRACILGHSPLDPHGNLRKSVERFDWKNLAPVYDEQFEQVRAFNLNNS